MIAMGKAALGWSMIGLVWVMVGCTHFRSETVAAYADPVRGGTVVLLDFEVERRRAPVLDSSGFEVVEDGVALSRKEQDQLVQRSARPSLLLLLDVSSGIYGNEVGAERIRAQLQPVVDELIKQVPVEIWLFANKAWRVQDVRDIAGEISTVASRDNRFSSVYGTLNRALRRTDHRVVVMLTDGADNKQDEPGRDVRQLARVCRRAGVEDQRAVYVFGFGEDLSDDHDRDNVAAERALEILAHGCGTRYVYGARLALLRDAIHSATSAYYVLGYTSASTSGRHDIRVRFGRSAAYSRRLGFEGKEGYSCSTSAECRAVGERLRAAGMLEVADDYLEVAQGKNE